MSAVTVRLTMDCADCGVGYYQELATPEHPGHWDKRGRLQLPAAVTDHECPSAAAVPEAQDGRPASMLGEVRIADPDPYPAAVREGERERAVARGWDEGYTAAEVFWTRGTGRIPNNPYRPSLAAPEGTEQ